MGFINCFGAACVKSDCASSLTSQGPVAYQVTVTVTIPSIIIKCEQEKDMLAVVAITCTGATPPPVAESVKLILALNVTVAPVLGKLTNNGVPGRIICRVSDISSGQQMPFACCEVCKLGLMLSCLGKKPGQSLPPASR